MNISKRNPYDQYRKTSVSTASPGKLLMMLYDGLMVFLKQAKQAVQDEKLEEAHTNLVKSQDILSELMGTLNMEIPLSENLYKLYDFQKEQLVKANMEKDPELIAQVIETVDELRQTWAEATGQKKVSPQKGQDDDE